LRSQLLQRERTHQAGQQLWLAKGAGDSLLGQNNLQLLQQPPQEHAGREVKLKC
jgi:hypothetical protein